MPILKQKFRRLVTHIPIHKNAHFALFSFLVALHLAYLVTGVAGFGIEGLDTYDHNMLGSGAATSGLIYLLLVTLTMGVVISTSHDLELRNVWEFSDKSEKTMKARPANHNLNRFWESNHIFEAKYRYYPIAKSGIKTGIPF